MLTLLLGLACADAPPAPPPAAPVATPAPAPAATTARIAFLGDSLSAGMGLPADDAFPAVLGRQWREAGLAVEVINAGVSGDTTAGGVRRVDWLLAQGLDVLVVELGANDMFRGVAAAEVDTNLRTIVTRARAAGVAVVLLGMRGNPTLGPEYQEAFDAVYPRLAAELEVPLVPFLLEGIAGDPALNQADGIHPTAEGHQRIATTVAPTLGPVVKAALAAKAGR